VFINILLELLWEDTLLKLLDIPNKDGLLTILGMILGETKDLSKLLMENVELIHNAMLVKFDLTS